ncbi:type II secretion system minor pseudopilin GspI [Thiofilum flexile]|uniref:type II secretion system minor pseudopilin GspI n=1 Tax=Thiofilum flexile TaxID=125627 RepID=UPI00037290C4|nr:type II secretion system minor pseudopilin GspI [Thiofilum flexile]
MSNWPKSGVAAQAGFSLIEVLVALLILGLVLGATSQLVGSALNTVSVLESNTLGSWVALNQISRAQLDQASEGETQGETLMAGRTWYWRQTIKPTPEAELLEIVVEVSTQADNFDKRVALEHGFRLTKL